MYFLELYGPTGKKSDVSFQTIEQLITFDYELDTTREHFGEAIGSGEHEGWIATKVQKGYWSVTRAEYEQ